MSYGRASDNNFETPKLECPDEDDTPRPYLSKFDDDTEIKDMKLIRNTENVVFVNPVERSYEDTLQNDRVPVGWKPLEVAPNMHHAILSLIERKRKEQESTASMLEARKRRLETKKRRRELAGIELDRLETDLVQTRTKKEDLTKKKGEVFAKLKLCLNKETALKKTVEEKKNAELQRLQAKYPKAYETIMHCLQNPMNQQSNSLISQQNVMFNQQALTQHLLSMQQQQHQQTQQLSNALTQQLFQQQLNASLPQHRLAQLQIPMTLGAEQQLTQTLAKAAANQPLRPVPTASSQSAMGPPMYGRQPSRSFSHVNKSILSPRRDTMAAAVPVSPRINQLSRPYGNGMQQQEVKVEASSPAPSPAPFYQQHPLPTGTTYGGVKLEYGTQNDNSAADALGKAYRKLQQEQALQGVPQQLLQPQLAGTSIPQLVGTPPQLLSAASNQLTGTPVSQLVVNTGAQLTANNVNQLASQSFSNPLSNVRRDSPIRPSFNSQYAAQARKDLPYQNTVNPTQQLSPNVQNARVASQSNNSNVFSNPNSMPYRRK